jgi:hypothetical protein
VNRDGLLARSDADGWDAPGMISFDPTETAAPPPAPDLGDNISGERSPGIGEAEPVTFDVPAYVPELTAADPPAHLTVAWHVAPEALAGPLHIEVPGTERLKLPPPADAP